MSSSTMIRVVQAVLGVLATVMVLLTGACSAPETEPLIRRQPAPPVTIDPAQACTRDAPAGGRESVEEGDVQATYLPATNTIEFSRGKASLPALAAAVDSDVLREVEDGVWELRSDLAVSGEALLQIAAPEVRWLKLISDRGTVASLKPTGGGTLDIVGTCITSWDAATNAADINGEDGRGYLLARDGATMNIDNAELRYLGTGAAESYGLSWRNKGTTGRITGSISSHNHFGMYSYEVGELVVTDNEFHDNYLYGIDPHTGSTNLLIERNHVHDNGKHGIILAEDCTDSIIRDNVVYRNKHHGIVLYLNSDRNVIEGNDTFGNLAQGINVNGSDDNVVLNNQVYDNAESGISVTQASANNLIESNQARGNGEDGIRVVTESTQTRVRDNTIGENIRYGIYIDVDGGIDISKNMIFGNRAGIMLKGAAAVPEDNNVIFGNEEREVIDD